MQRQAIGIWAHPRACPGQARPAFLVLQTRRYATHRDQGHTPPRSSGSNSHLHDRQSAFAGQEHVGPFPLGVGGSTFNTPWKPWAELNFGGKIKRTVRQSANLGLILIGGTLCVVITLSLGTDLFAPNSPNVLYGKAIDLIRASDALDDYLLPPMTFTHSQYSSAPSRGNTPVAHTQVRNPVSGRDHLILTFYVHGRGRGEPEPMHWAKQTWTEIETLVRQSLVDYGWIDPEPVKDKVEEKNKAAEQVEEEGSSWLGRAFGSFTSLRSSVASGAASLTQRGLPPPGTYKMGEVHGDYVKNASGQYQLLSLTIDVPSSSASWPGRAVVFWSPEADKEGLIGRRR